MNNSLDRVFEGIAVALRRDVIPRLDDEYATGQALAIIDLLNNLRPRLDWAVSPLLARSAAQRTLIGELEELLGQARGRPCPDEDFGTVPPDGRALHALCDRMDAFIGATLRWLGAGPGVPAPVATLAHAAITRHVYAELRRDMALTPRPLFGDIARGSDTSASSPASYSAVSLPVSQASLPGS